MKNPEQIDLFGETEAAQPEVELADELCADRKIHVMCATEEDARRFQELVERATGQKITHARTFWFPGPLKEGR
jgi:hypothetical protein